jgi:hypothetical protein
MRRMKRLGWRCMAVTVLLGCLVSPSSASLLTQAYDVALRAPLLSWETVETLSLMKPGPETKNALTTQRVRVAGFIYQWHTRLGSREFILVPKSTCFVDPKTWRASSVILVRMPPRTPRPVGCHPVLVEGTLRWDDVTAPNRRPLLESAEVTPDWERMIEVRERTLPDAAALRTL